MIGNPSLARMARFMTIVPIFGSGEFGINRIVTSALEALTTIYDFSTDWSNTTAAEGRPAAGGESMYGIHRIARDLLGA